MFAAFVGSLVDRVRIPPPPEAPRDSDCFTEILEIACLFVVDAESPVETKLKFATSVPYVFDESVDTSHTFA